MDGITVLLVGMKPDVEGRLAIALGQHKAIRSVPNAAAARSALHGSRPTVAVAALNGSASPDTLDLVRELSSRSVAVVTVGAKKDSDVIIAAMRAGAREFLEEHDAESLEGAVQGLLAATGALQVGKITAVLSAKGGLGATTVATNLAGALHRRGKRVCVTDLDLEMGDVLSFLDMQGKYSFAEIAANVRRLDRDLLDQSVPCHASGVWVVSQTERVANADGVDAEKVGSVIRFLRPHYDHLVLDGVHGFGDVALTSLDLADHIILLVTQEVPAVRDAQRCVEIFERLGYEHSRLALVVNRYQKGSSITRAVIEETVGLEVTATIGNDFHSLSRAVNRGGLLWDEAPSSVVSKDIDAIAERLAPALAEPARPSLLKRLFSPKAVLHGAQ